MESGGEFDPYGLPKEIYSLTYPLIGVCGLDIDKNKSHRVIWEVFTMSRRSDRLPLKFILLNGHYDFPSRKQKRQSYEWYTPKGILKSNWISKYVDIIPAVIVLFWDLEWTDPNWEEKKNQIASTLQKLRLSLAGRATRIVVVLIQSSVGNPGDDGAGASEKAAILCSTCDLIPKFLFVLPHADSHLLGYTIRLENAFNEIAGGFYMGEIKSVKSHQSFLNKTNHQLLFIRHQFKIAFYSEMRGDPQTAIKQYTQSYFYLLEHRFTNTNLHEIRTVAAILNYKICKLNFALNLPRDAIEQFRKHIEVFRQRTGPKELIFEHYAWLSKQYQVFGEVFEEAVQEGLPAVQIQHPGFYYQQAAHCAVLRRSTALLVCKDASRQEVDLLAGWEALEFYGQRPWRPGRHLLEPPEMKTENDGIAAICYHETNEINHCSLIIPLFSSAITLFKKYRCPRIKKYLMVQMAKEYLEANQPSEALTLLNHVMWDYRNERWWPLLSSASKLALPSAYSMGSVQDYLSLCLEVLGPRITSSQEVKNEALENLRRIIDNEVPNAPEEISSEVSRNATELWRSNLSSSSSQYFTVNMNDILPCFEVRAGFCEASVPVDRSASVAVRVRNHLNEEFEFSYVSIQTDYAATQCMKETNPEKLQLSPLGILEVRLVLTPVSSDIGKTVKITGVQIGLSSKKSDSKTVVLQWTGVGDQGVTVHTSALFTSPKEFGPKIKNILEEVQLFKQLKVLHRSPKISCQLSFDECALVWEWLPISITLLNEESSTVTNLMLSIGLETGFEPGLERTTQLSLSCNLENKLTSSSLESHSLPDVAANDVLKFKVYVKSLTATKRCFQLKISYDCSMSTNETTLSFPSQLLQTFSIVSKLPFQISVDTQSMTFSPLSKVARGERFVVVPVIKCMSHVPIVFEDSSAVLSVNTVLEGENCSKVSQLEVSESEEVTDCFCLSVAGDTPVTSPVSLGQYLLYWKRCNSDEPTVRVSVGLPVINVEDCGVWVKAEIPPQAAVRTPLSISYDVTNTSDNVREFAVSMHASDAFMFSGPKEIRLRILPGWQERLNFNLYPLLAGYVQLPRLNMEIEETPKSQNAPSTAAVNEFIQRILPSHLFVTPQEKCPQGTSKNASQNESIITVN